ncbi:hypothetical protein NPIL_370831 [Nephila pilipes]|uniref:Uncharacterized protein n=1 Tax=Nephila pilipes TaxID=299642 RepID=A0A8X6PPG9_NEPPI|nr:hypothetical protein NPIL_370831 [Nephila pilipes]
MTRKILQFLSLALMIFLPDSKVFCLEIYPRKISKSLPSREDGQADSAIESSNLNSEETAIEIAVSTTIVNVGAVDGVTLMEENSLGTISSPLTEIETTHTIDTDIKNSETEDIDARIENAGSLNGEISEIDMSESTVPLNSEVEKVSKAQKRIKLKLDAQGDDTDSENNDDTLTSAESGSILSNPTSFEDTDKSESSETNEQFNQINVTSRTDEKRIVSRQGNEESNEKNSENHTEFSNLWSKSVEQIKWEADSNSTARERRGVSDTVFVNEGGIIGVTVDRFYN